MQKTFSKTPFFFSLALFAASLSVFIFLYRSINDNHSEARQKETEWQSEAKRREEIKALDRSVKAIEGERVELETHFAKSSDIVPFLDTIEGLASKVGAKAEVTSVDLSDARKELLVGMKASGTFGSLYKFLTLLENSPYELEFTAVEIKRETVPGAGIGFPKWNATFRLKLLSFIE